MINSKIGQSQPRAVPVRPQAARAVPTPSLPQDRLEPGEGLVRLQPPRQALQTFKSFGLSALSLTTLSLPSLALTLAGPLSLAGTVTLSSTLAGLVSPKGAKVASALVAGCLSGLAGLPALGGPLGVAVMGGAGLLGALVAARSRPAPRNRPELLVNRELLARELGAELPVRPRLTSDAKWKRICGTCLAQSFDQAAQQLGVAGAVSLWADTSRRLLTRQDERRLNHLRAIEIQGDCRSLGDGLTLVKGNLGILAPAFCSGTQIALDQGYFDSKPAAVTDLVIGHELSHLHNRDQAVSLGKMALLEAIEGQKPSWLNSRSWTVRDLQLAQAAYARDNETRCDRDGASYALAKGHRPDDIASAAEQLFTGKDRLDPLDSHPANFKRIQAIRLQVEGG